ncbi:MAG: 23S rRNA (guanosine(2251)-2'-O)-methyltransferase RlmB [Thiohalocapsa sp.]
MRGQERRRRDRPQNAPLPVRAPAGEEAPPRPRRERGQGYLYGRHAVAAALANPERRWHRLAALADHAAEATALVAAAQAQFRGGAEPVQLLDRLALDRLLPEGAVHQGLALQVEPLPQADLDDVLRAVAIDEAGGEGRALVVVLDRVSDPHNVGAVLRSAAAFGAAGIIVPAHGTPPATGALAKAAAGALDCLKLVRAGNLVQALERLKAAGFWCVGLDERAPAPLADLDLGPRVALVLGAEGSGLRRLVRERCDHLARLPTRPPLPSLNVSNAAAIALYELRRSETAAPASRPA